MQSLFPRSTIDLQPLLGAIEEHIWTEKLAEVKV